jgi:hypothetical protein
MIVAKILIHNGIVPQIHHGPQQRPSWPASRGQSGMHGPVTLRAKADEILVGVFALLAPALNVMNLKPGYRSAVQASPAVSLQDLLAQYLVGVRIQPNPGTFS